MWWHKAKAPDPVPPEALEETKTDNASLAAFEAQMYGVAVGGLDRAKNGATVVQTASTAIAALFTGVLGFVFSAQGTTFPLRGLITPLFLGVAVVLSTFYLAFITPAYTVLRTWPGAKSLGENVQDRIDFIGDYVERVIRRRSWALRAAVVALAVGLVGMALPFISGSSSEPAQPTMASVSSAPEPTGWPTPDPINTEEPGAVDLAKIKYQAQIEEYRAHLSYTKSVQPDDLDSMDFFLKALWIGIAAVVFLPLLLLFLDWLFHEVAGWVEKRRLPDPQSD
jgi:hypothetical protein